MSIKIVTGYQGRNHVTSNDVGGFQQGVVGTEDYVLGVGEQAKATLISNNSVRISDGELVMQGVHWRIKPGTYENVTINNGNQGMKRKDAIVARHKRFLLGNRKHHPCRITGNSDNGNAGGAGSDNRRHPIRCIKT